MSSPDDPGVLRKKSLEDLRRKVRKERRKLVRRINFAYQRIYETLKSVGVRMGILPESDDDPEISSGSEYGKSEWSPSSWSPTESSPSE